MAEAYCVKQTKNSSVEKEFELRAESKTVPDFRKQLSAELEKSGMPGKASQDVLVAVSEALTNMIRHSYESKGGKIQVAYRDYPDRIEITIRDYGKKFDAGKVPGPCLPPTEPGGLGLYLIKTLMDKVEYDPQCEKGNRLHLTKYKK